MKARALSVRVAGTAIGTLFYEDWAYTFRYDDPSGADPLRHLVSLTMPVRSSSYETQVLPPPFQSVLPEGELLSRLRARYGKVLPVDDDFELQDHPALALGGRKLWPARRSSTSGSTRATSGESRCDGCSSA